MIYFLTGDNDYEIFEFTSDLRRTFDGQIDIVDGSSELDLTTLLLGQTLFSSSRLIIFKDLSSNKDAWNSLPDYLDKIGNNSNIIIVEASPDKRTKTYKEIISYATHKHFDKYDAMSRMRLKSWLISYAEGKDIRLSSQMAELLINRVGFDQWSLVNALERVLLAGEISEQSIIDQTELSPTENIFQLLETAFRGETNNLLRMIKTLKHSEDAYKTMGLIASQLMLLAAIKNAREGHNVAKDFGANPYMISKLKSIADKTSATKISKAVRALNLADDQSKTSSIDPWVSLEQALLKINVD